MNQFSNNFSSHLSHGGKISDISDKIWKCEELKNIFSFFFEFTFGIGFFFLSASIHPIFFITLMRCLSRGVERDEIFRTTNTIKFTFFGNLLLVIFVCSRELFTLDDMRGEREDLALAFQSERALVEPCVLDMRIVRIVLGRMSSSQRREAANLKKESWTFQNFSISSSPHHSQHWAADGCMWVWLHLKSQKKRQNSHHRTEVAQQTTWLHARRRKSLSTEWKIRKIFQIFFPAASFCLDFAYLFPPHSRLVRPLFIHVTKFFNLSSVFSYFSFPLFSSLLSAGWHTLTLQRLSTFLFQLKLATLTAADMLEEKSKIEFSSLPAPNRLTAPSELSHGLLMVAFW